jgi:hypothetical protein
MDIDFVFASLLIKLERLFVVVVVGDVKIFTCRILIREFS